MSEIIIRKNLRVLEFQDPSGEYVARIVLDRDAGTAHVEIRVGIGNEPDQLQSLTLADARTIKSWGIEAEARLLKVATVAATAAVAGGESMDRERVERQDG